MTRMNVRIIRGYVSHKTNLYSVGDVIDLQEQDAKRLIIEGVVEAVEEKVVEAAAPKQEQANTAIEDAVLPVADPVASVKKGKKK